MIRYTIPAILVAAVPLSLAAAEPTPPADSTPSTNCPQMQQHMGDGSMGSSGHMMQHGDHAMGSGTMAHGNMGAGNMQGQMMQHDGGTMGPGNHQAMMQGQGNCPAANQPEDGKSKDSK